MTIDEKVNSIFKFLQLHWKLTTVLNEKTDNVKKQDFQAAIHSREKEQAIRKEIDDLGKLFDELLTSEQNPERSVATGDIMEQKPGK